MRSGVKGAVKERCAPPAAQGANVSLGAVVLRPLSAFRTPGHDPIARFGLLNVNHVDTIFSVLGQTCDGSWLRVELPVRPNGKLGRSRLRARFAAYTKSYPRKTGLACALTR